MKDTSRLDWAALCCVIVFAASVGCASGVRTSTCVDRPCVGDISYFLPKRLVRADLERKVVPIEQQKLVATASAGAAEAAKTQAVKDAKEAKRAASLANEPLGAGAGTAAVNADLALRQATHSLAAAQQAQAVAEEADQLLHAAIAGDECVYVLELQAEPVIPDTSQRFMLSLDHGSWNDDDLKIQTTESGLIKSLSSTSTDRAGDVAVEIAKAAAKVAKLIAGFPIPSGGEVVQAADLPMCPEFKKRYYVDPSDPVEVERLQGQLVQEANGVRLVVEDLTTPCTVGEMIESKNASGATVKTECGDPKGKIDLSGRPRGLLNRRSVPFKVTLSTPDGAPIDQAVSIVTAVPDSRTDALMSLESGLFVTRTYGAEFTDGALTRFDQNKPSEVYGGAMIPNRVLSEIVSIPTDLLQLKVDYSTKDRTLVENQKALLEAQQAVQAIQQQMSPGATLGQ